ETFTSTTSGDMHRTGKHGQITGPARRRCLTEAEMLDQGMTRNRSGQWTTGLVDTRWNAAHCSHVDTESDEQGQTGTHGPQATERPSESRIRQLATIEDSDE
ncbi:hypothetical protein, partial [Collinsella sp. Sow4_E3]|uniref:hypothetical protein n=1 Tax=Collinsella sp. Sow4_E3 TaxID=3438776 RepID=UPI003F91FC9E